jgi:hypothetical protein
LSARTAANPTPWDALLHPTPRRPAPVAGEGALQARPGTKLAALLAELAGCESLPTLALALRADLTPRQVWGLLKAPRTAGQVRFEAGRWALVHDFAGRDVQRAAELLRAHGWRVQPPGA